MAFDPHQQRTIKIVHDECLEALVHKDYDTAINTVTELDTLIGHFNIAGIEKHDLTSIGNLLNDYYRKIEDNVKTRQLKIHMKTLLLRLSVIIASEAESEIAKIRNELTPNSTRLQIYLITRRADNLERGAVNFCRDVKTLALIEEWEKASVRLEVDGYPEKGE